MPNADLPAYLTAEIAHWRKAVATTPHTAPSYHRACGALAALRGVRAELTRHRSAARHASLGRRTDPVPHPTGRGALRRAHFCHSREEAEVVATKATRIPGRTAKIAYRKTRADGLDLALWIVIVRQRRDNQNRES